MSFGILIVKLYYSYYNDWCNRLVQPHPSQREDESCHTTTDELSLRNYCTAQLNLSWLSRMSRMQKQAARVRACNYIKFEPRRNLPPCARCVHVGVDIIYYALLLSTHVTSYFLYGSIILPGLQASIGVARSYSSRPFLCTLVHVKWVPSSKSTIWLWKISAVAVTW